MSWLWCHLTVYICQSLLKCTLIMEECSICNILLQNWFKIFLLQENFAFNLQCVLCLLCFKRNPVSQHILVFVLDFPFRSRLYLSPKLQIHKDLSLLGLVWRICFSQEDLGHIAHLSCSYSICQDCLVWEVSSVLEAPSAFLEQLCIMPPHTVPPGSIWRWPYTVLEITALISFYSEAEWRLGNVTEEQHCKEFLP